MAWWLLHWNKTHIFSIKLNEILDNVLIYDE